jgi:phosphatidylglycerol:prolipoprotein diacylglycerol transferase
MGIPLILESPGPVLVQVGPLALRWYGLLISSAVLMGLLLSRQLARGRELDPDLINRLLVWLMVGSLPAARLYYVLFEWDRYRNGPWWQVLAIWQGGIAIHGALLGGGLAVLLFARNQGLSWRQLGSVTDCLMPAVILGQALGRWGNFFNNEAYGRVIQAGQGWLVQLRLPTGDLVHPTFLYESLWNLGVFALLWPLMRRRDPWGQPVLPPGSGLGIYLIGYSLGRVWIEGLRTDSLMLGSLRVAQLVSVIMMVAGALLLWQVRRTAQPQPVDRAMPMKPMPIEPNPTQSSDGDNDG